MPVNQVGLRRADVEAHPKELKQHWQDFSTRDDSRARTLLASEFVKSDPAWRAELEHMATARQKVHPPPPTLFVRFALVARRAILCC